MKIFNWLLMAILMIVLAACLMMFPFIYALDNIFLSEDFYTETLNDLGTYDAAYDVFALKLNEMAVQTAEEKGVSPEAAEWIAENVLIVFNHDYVAGLMEEQATGMMHYLKGETESIPTFDLEPKYEELKQVTEDRLDADTVMLFLNAEQDGFMAALLKITGIVDDNGEINPQVKEYAVDAVFDSNPQIEAAFQIKNSVEALKMIGMENPEARLDKAKTQATAAHRAAMPMLLAISCLTALILLVGLKKIKVPIAIDAWTYTVTSVSVIVIGSWLAISSRVFEKLAGRIGFPDLALARQLHIDQMIAMFGKGVLSVGLILLAAGTVFLILSAVCRYKKRREKRI